LPIMGAVFIAFLVIGMALPVLPLHVHQGLGLSTFIVALVAGTQFAAATLSRVWAGRTADASGAKRAINIGLLIAAMSGLVYLASLRFVANPTLSATILLLGRALLGVGESFIITGGQSWGLALLGGATARLLPERLRQAPYEKARRHPPPGHYEPGAPIGR
ncbi:MAG: MFS transporter, partial [Microvirga sp.]